MNVEWRLPSPACPQLQVASPCRAPISSVRSTASASLSNGTTMSSLTLPPRCADTAIDTPSRQRQSAATSTAEAGMWNVSAPSVSASRSSAWSRLASPAEPSASAITMKRAASGTGAGKLPRAASSAPASRYSSAAAAMPFPSTEVIAAVPEAMSR